MASTLRPSDWLTCLKCAITWNMAWRRGSSSCRRRGQVQRLRQVLRQMREVADRGGYSADYDETFHRLLYENVDNSVLLTILQVFWSIYRQAQDMVAMLEPADPLDTYQRHADIVEALEERDIAAMQTAMVRHRKGVDTRVKMLEQAQTQEVVVRPS